MDDLISRQWLMECFNEGWIKFDTKKDESRFIHLIRDIAPSEEPRMKGKWIYGEDEYGIDGYHCDKCGFFVPWDYVHKFINYIEDYNFCPNCGAQMDGGKAEYGDGEIHCGADMRGEEDDCK